MSSSSFTEEQTELLIDLVRQYPVLYNLQHKNYFNNNIKENAWKIISEAINKSVNDCKTRWKTIRDSYRKQIKKVGSGSAANVRSKYSNEKLSFLKSASTYRETKSSITLPVTQLTENEHNENEPTGNEPTGIEPAENVYDRDEPEKVEDSDVSNISANASTSSTRQQLSDYAKENDLAKASVKKRRHTDLAEEMRKSRIQREQLLSKTLNNDPVDAFFKGVAATVKTFPPRLIVETKLEVSKLISEFEIRALNYDNEKKNECSFSTLSAEPRTPISDYEIISPGPSSHTCEEETTFFNL